MRHLRLLQYYYLQEAYWDFNFPYMISVGKYETVVVI